MKTTRAFICLFLPGLIFLSCQNQEGQKNISGNKIVDQLLSDQLAAVEKSKRVDPVRYFMLFEKTAELDSSVSELIKEYKSDPSHATDYLDKIRENAKKYRNAFSRASGHEIIPDSLDENDFINNAKLIEYLSIGETWGRVRYSPYQFDALKPVVVPAGSDSAKIYITASSETQSPKFYLVKDDNSIDSMIPVQQGVAILSPENLSNAHKGYVDIKKANGANDRYPFEINLKKKK
jgi:hypothetical protein